jgi:hypothetical protein
MHDPRLDLDERVGEIPDAGRRLLQEMEREALGRLGADARQTLEGLDQPSDGGRVRGHAPST